jgi:hypothetical protein
VELKYIFWVMVIIPSSPNSLSASSSDETRKTGDPSTSNFLISSGPKRQLPKSVRGERKWRRREKGDRIEGVRHKLVEV